MYIRIIYTMYLYIIGLHTDEEKVNSLLKSFSALSNLIPFWNVGVKEVPELQLRKNPQEITPPSNLKGLRLVYHDKHISNIETLLKDYYEKFLNTKYSVYVHTYNVERNVSIDTFYPNKFDKTKKLSLYSNYLSETLESDFYEYSSTIEEFNQYLEYVDTNIKFLNSEKKYKKIDDDSKVEYTLEGYDLNSQNITSEASEVKDSKALEEGVSFLVTFNEDVIIKKTEFILLDKLFLPEVKSIQPLDIDFSLALRVSDLKSLQDSLKQHEKEIEEEEEKKEKEFVEDSDIKDVLKSFLSDNTVTTDNSRSTLLSSLYTTEEKEHHKNIIQELYDSINKNDVTIDEEDDNKVFTNVNDVYNFNTKYGIGLGGITDITLQKLYDTITKKGVVVTIDEKVESKHEEKETEIEIPIRFKELKDEQHTIIPLHFEETTLKYSVDDIIKKFFDFFIQNIVVEDEENNLPNEYIVDEFCYFVANPKDYLNELSLRSMYHDVSSDSDIFYMRKPYDLLSKNLPISTETISLDELMNKAKLVAKEGISGSSNMSLRYIDIYRKKLYEDITSYNVVNSEHKIKDVIKTVYDLSINTKPRERFWSSYVSSNKKYNQEVLTKLILLFSNKCIVKTSNNNILSSNLYNEFLGFLRFNRFETLESSISNISFTVIMKKLGYKTKRTSSGNAYVDIEMKEKFTEEWMKRLLPNSEQDPPEKGPCEIDGGNITYRVMKEYLINSSSPL